MTIPNNRWLVASLLLATLQVQAHDSGNVVDDWGNDITTGTGDCVIFGTAAGRGCVGGAPVRADTATTRTTRRTATSDAATQTGSSNTRHSPATESDQVAMASSSTEGSSTTQEPEVARVIDLVGVIFKSNSDELDASSNESLDQAVKTLQTNPDVRVIVAGHTDSRGDARYNLALSEKRARIVRDYLIARGVESSRLSARGYGETEPVASNETATGRAMNRRVELRILK